MLLPGLRRAAWGIVLLLLSRFPWAVKTLPCLGLLKGPLGWGLAGLTLLVGIGIGLPRLRARPLVLLFLSFGFFLGLGIPYASRVQPSGDEPHYLLMAQSLWRERDLDLRDNLARGDYREYLPGDRPLEPHYGAPRADGRPFPGHSPGLPLLLAPAYALGGRWGCLVLMTLMAASLAFLIRGLCARVASEEAATAAWMAVVLAPLAFYSFHLYTEVPSGLGAAASLTILLSSPGPFLAGVAALIAGFLPWLHVKMIPAAVVLGLVAFTHLRGRPRWAFLLVAALMAVGFLGYYQAVFGRPTPLAIYGGVPRDASGSPLQAAVGLLLDRSFGLLPYAPVFLIALAGFPVLFAGPKREGWVHLFVALAILGPILPWRMWWGGQCPPARFLVPLLPQLGVLLALRIDAGRKGVARWLGPLLGVGLVLTIFVALHADERLLLTHGDRPSRVWEAVSGDVSPARYLPSLVKGGGEEYEVALLWGVLLTILFVLDGLAVRREKIDALFRGLGLPLGLLLLLGALVDRWVRPL